MTHSSVIAIVFPWAIMSSSVAEHEIEKAVSKASGQRWMIARLVVAAILLVAAGAKAHQLATVPSFGEGILEARWFNILVVEFELFFGIWLIFGMLPKWTWLVSMVLFSVFATVSAFKGLSGEASCGCFGAVTVNPWLTTGGDLAVVGMLVWVRPKDVLAEFLHLSSSISFCKTALCLGIFVLVGGTTFGWIRQAQFEKLTEVGQVLHGNTVQLIPESWTGQKFPLQEYIVGDDGLMLGERKILLSRPGCSDCEEAKQNLRNDETRENISISILEISGDKHSNGSFDKNVAYYRLTSEFEWLAETPILIELGDGVIKNVRNREDLISSEKNTLFGNASADFRQGFQ